MIDERPPTQAVFELRGYELTDGSELSLSLAAGEVRVLELPGPARRRLLRGLLLGRPESGSFKLRLQDGWLGFPGADRPRGAVGLWQLPTPWPWATPLEALRLAARGGGRRELIGIAGLLGERSIDNGGGRVNELTVSEEVRLALALGLAAEPVLLLADDPLAACAADVAGELLDGLPGCLDGAACLYLRSGERP